MGTEPEPSLGKTAEHTDNGIGRRGRDKGTSIHFSNALYTRGTSLIFILDCEVEGCCQDLWGALRTWPNVG